MYFVCPICNTASWIPMGNGIMAQYENSQVVIPKTKLNKRQIKWSCKCLKDKQKQEEAEASEVETTEAEASEVDETEVSEVGEAEASKVDETNV